MADLQQQLELIDDAAHQALYAKALTGAFTNRKDLHLHTYAWLPKQGKPTASVFIFHGFGEHAERYRWLACALATKGFAVFSFDLQGHGRSAGQRGYVEHYQDYVRDTCDFISKIPTAYLKLPKFLIGAGLGATIASMTITLTRARRADFFAGVVFISPAVQRGPGFVTTGAVKRASLFGRRVRIAEPQHRSSDPEVVANYRMDSLVFNSKVKIRMATELGKAMAWLAANNTIAKMSFPFLICQGSADQIASPFGAKLLYDNAPSKDKEFKIYKGMYHDIIHDTGHEQVVDDIVSWIASRAEDAPVTPIPEDLGTPRFFPEEKKKLGSVRSKLSGSIRSRSRTGSIDVASLSDLLPGTQSIESPAFSTEWSMTLTEPAFASIEEFEFDASSEESIETAVSPRTIERITDPQDA